MEVYRKKVIVSAQFFAPALPLFDVRSWIDVMGELYSDVQPVLALQHVIFDTFKVPDFDSLWLPARAADFKEYGWQFEGREDEIVPVTIHREVGYGVIAWGTSALCDNETSTVCLESQIEATKAQQAEELWREYGKAPPREKQVGPSMFLVNA